MASLTADNPSQVLEAVESFATDLESGERITVNAQTTRISADHELARRFPENFRPVEENLSYQTEAATDIPGESRARRAAARAAGSSTES